MEEEGAAAATITTFLTQHLKQVYSGALHVEANLIDAKTFDLVLAIEARGVSLDDVRAACGTAFTVEPQLPNWGYDQRGVIRFRLRVNE
jgi:hypothetical protein